MTSDWDVFVSYAHEDARRVAPFAEALRLCGLHVWLDETEVADFASITRAIERGLARARALVAYYSRTYPTKRPCQWELTAAFLAAQRGGDPLDRVLIINPEPGVEHIDPAELRDGLFARAP